MGEDWDHAVDGDGRGDHRSYSPTVIRWLRVVMDPVIRASSGKEFWKRLDRDEWEEVAAKCYLVTPNWEEIGWLYPGEDTGLRCADLSSRAACHIYLKGGHNREHPGRDYLWSEGEAEVLERCWREIIRQSMGQGACCHRRWRRTWHSVIRCRWRRSGQNGISSDF